MNHDKMILAMWSGPRNLSTAMMRSFAQRPDTQVWDEPFYAAYLAATGLAHPMREEVILDGIADAGAVAQACLAPPGDGKRVFYQKHMTHHMLPQFDTGFISQLVNAFLIRSPERVLASYVRKHEQVGAEDIGLRMQRQLFEREADRLGHAPPVVDSTDIRENPAATLRGLCEALGIGFTPAMLTWKPGPAPEDGIWGRHWYDAIWKSTGFAPPDQTTEELPRHLAEIADAVRDDYEYLRAFAIR
ncbi:MAG: hypothetical protein WBO55_18080 [Rhizobiaceae bacterium]